MTGKQKKIRRPPERHSALKPATTPSGKPLKGRHGKPPKTPVKFSRALLPPEKFHSTKKGSRGYSRADEKRNTRRAEKDSEADSSNTL